MNLHRVAALVQGIFFAVTGFGLVINRPSFEAITGPKADFWLVRTISAQLGVIGLVLAWYGMRQSQSPDVSLLGASSAAGLAASDLVYSTKGRISPLYLFDFIAEIGLWLIALTRHAQER